MGDLDFLDHPQTRTRSTVSYAARQPAPQSGGFRLGFVTGLGIGVGMACVGIVGGMISALLIMALNR
ncbi:MAG: hypothetical protein ABSG68_26875 [Thermoguttaceae bacterium]|jgi:predicted lipid-binding transport protein (Tim44 family)